MRCQPTPATGTNASVTINVARLKHAGLVGVRGRYPERGRSPIGSWLQGLDGGSLVCQDVK